MATEKRLIDANETINAFTNWLTSRYDGRLPRDIVAEIPTVDAVEVVRCKDCEFWNDGWFPECTMGKCKRGKPVLTEPHHYCSYGVRRLDVPVIIKDESFVVKEETEK